MKHTDTEPLPEGGHSPQGKPPTPHPLHGPTTGAKCACGRPVARLFARRDVVRFLCDTCEP